MWPVFEKAFYDSRRTVLWLCIGLGVYALFTAGLFPSIAESGEEYNELLESMPESLTGLFGTDGTTLDFTHPVGYLSVEFMTWAMLILGAIVMMQAFNAVTNAERDGTMDVMMAFPVSRRQVLAGRYLNTIVTLLIVLTAICGTLLVSTRIWPVFDILAGDLLTIVYGSLLILVPYATFTYALTSFVPSSKKWAGSLAYAVFFGMYLVHGLSGSSDVLTDIRPFLLFDYYNAVQVAREGFDLLNIFVMAVVTVLFGGLAWWQFDNKDLGV